MAQGFTTEKKNDRQQKQNWLLERIQDLQVARTNYNIETQWEYAEKVMIPHRFIDTGLRSWQSKNAKMVAFTKVHTALSLIIDQNPEAQLFARNEESQGKVLLLKGLYNYSWEHGDGRVELKKFSYDCAKYGLAVGRTYHRRDEREIDELILYDPVTNNSEYEKKIIVDFDDVYFENMDVWNCWFDEQADSKKNMRDWCWRKILDFETFKLKFPKEKFDNIEEVKSGGDTSHRKFPKASTTLETSLPQNTSGKEMIEIYFYENKEKDRFQILANGTMILDIPLPYKHKQLSCIFATWWPRATDTIYGIGIPELTKSNTELLNKIVNMRIDQVTLSVYKMLLYGGAEEFNEEDLDLEPGKAKKVFDVNNYKWLENPGAGVESYKEEEMILNDVDEETGVTKSLGGREIGRTATEISLNREAGLRRMKTPLDSIEDALEEEGYLRIALIQQVYSTPEKIEKIVGADGLEDYEIKNRKLRLPLTKGESGEIQPTQNDNFFEILPDDIRGEFDVKIQPMSTIPISEELEKQRKLQLYNIIAPSPYVDIYKASQELVKAFGEDPEDWLMSEEDIIATQQKAQQNQMMLPEEMPAGEMEGGAPTVIPQREANPDLSALFGAQGVQT